MKRGMGLLPALVLGALLTAPGAWAQRQGRGGVVGTVSKVDAAAGTLEVSTRRGGTQSVTVPASAVILRETTVSVSDLKTGDTITVVGVPRQIDARLVQSGESFETLLRPQGANVGAARRFQGQGGRTGLLRGGVRVRGTVASTSPLQLKMEDGTTVQVAHSSDTRFHRTVKGTLADLKSGESVRVVMEPGGGAVRAVLVSLEQGRQVRLDGSRSGGRGNRAALNAAPMP